MNTTLVVMAAGIGSRYGGGIKQLASVGPNGEILLDYSIYDAKRAGFDRVVFVIRRDIEKDFREILGDRMADDIDVSYAFQEREDLPDGFHCPKDRVKPWGTGQAILCCKDIVKEPFIVINADDFYGKGAYRILHDYLCEGVHTKGETKDICLAGYILENTLSENGGVTRGICRTDTHNRLLSIEETKEIRRRSGGMITAPFGEGEQVLRSDCKVSMNMWGLTPDFFPLLENGFRDFLAENEEDIKAEFLLPVFIGKLIADGKAHCTMLPTRDKWFGLTYKEDLPTVRKEIEARIASGEYPNVLTSQKA